MANNTELNAGAGGDTISTEDIGGIKVQRIKIITGAAGLDDGDVTASNLFPVGVGGGSVGLLAGAAHIGSVAVDSTVGLTDAELRATAVPISAASLPLPTGAATSAAQLPDGHNVTVDNAAGAAAVNIQDGGNTITVDGTVATTPPANASTNIAQMNGVAVTMGNGVSGTGVQRVTIASDSTGQVTLAAGANTIGALTANQSVNTAQIAGATTLTGNGVTGAGSQRVTIASNNTAFTVNAAQATAANLNAQVVGNVAADSATSGNPVQVAGQMETLADSAPSTRMSADGDVNRPAMTDGAAFVIPSGPQNWSYHENSSSTLTDTTVHAAPGAGLSLYVQTIVVSTGAATAFNVFFEEGGTTVLGPWYLEAVAGRGMCINFLSPKKITANTALTVTTSAAIAHSIDVTGFTAPG